MAEVVIKELFLVQILGRFQVVGIIYHRLVPVFPEDGGDVGYAQVQAIIVTAH